MENCESGVKWILPPDSWSLKLEAICIWSDTFALSSGGACMQNLCIFRKKWDGDCDTCYLSGDAKCLGCFKVSLIISKLKLWACWKLKIFEFPSKPFKFNKTTAWPEISIPMSCLNSLSLFQTLKLFVSVKLESSFATLTTYNYRKLGQIKVCFYSFTLTIL